MTLSAAFCEYHRFDSPIQVGSHHIARDHRRRGFSTFWLPHPQTFVRKIRGGHQATFIEHGPNVIELTLTAKLPYYDLPVIGTSWWGQRWITDRPQNLELIHDIGI